MECKYCKTLNHSDAVFCRQCGCRLVRVVTTEYRAPLNRFLVYFFALFAYIVLLIVTNFSNSSATRLFSGILFAVIVLIFVFFESKPILTLLIKHRPSIKSFLLIIFITPITALLIFFAVRFCNHFFWGANNLSYYKLFSDSVNPLLSAIITVAVLPAIFEEIAFRGLIFNQLEKLCSNNASIVVSALLFTILHLSIISILWIFPLGLLFGYWRVKYKTLWYGILCHFMHNVAVVFIGYYFF